MVAGGAGAQPCRMVAVHMQGATAAGSTRGRGDYFYARVRAHVAAARAHHELPIVVAIPCCLALIGSWNTYKKLSQEDTTSALYTCACLKSSNPCHAMIQQVAPSGNINGVMSLLPCHALP